ncbi:MAG: hypothetical protein LBB66_05040 [Desulfovibrio sp.]|jgi:hypothetical protein|nr:hypothetical protein [Desulfovibrio sp.]
MSKQENFVQNLINALARWQDVYENGGCDPFYSDGQNLRLIRNHILHYKRKIEETVPKESYPPEYFLPLPPVVDIDYMAKPDEIRRQAQLSLKLYKEDKNYIFLLARYNFLSRHDKESTEIEAVLNYCANLEHAVAADDLVTMRRHRNPELYLSSFRTCAARVIKIEPENLKPYQMSFLSGIPRGGSGRGR